MDEATVFVSPKKREKIGSRASRRATKREDHSQHHRDGRERDGRTRKMNFSRQPLHRARLVAARDPIQPIGRRCSFGLLLGIKAAGKVMRAARGILNRETHRRRNDRMEEEQAIKSQCCANFSAADNNDVLDVFRAVVAADFQLSYRGESPLSRFRVDVHIEMAPGSG